jgi:hypothetical protein
MKAEGLHTDMTEQIKWWDACDVLIGRWAAPDVARGLQMARESQRPDARWLVSLFPADGEVVTLHLFRSLLIACGDDPRAVVLCQSATNDDLRRAAEDGYAPAQALMAKCTDEKEGLAWCKKAAAQNDRDALFQVACCYLHARGCARDVPKAMELHREAAELGHVAAQLTLGLSAHEESDWRRYEWWARASSRGYRGYDLCLAMCRLLPHLLKGAMGQALQAAVPVIRNNFDAVSGTVFGLVVPEGDMRRLRQVLQLHDAMLSRAREAIACWSIVGRRCGLTKDVRVVVAKMAWEEAWQWHGKASLAARASDGAAQRCALQ